jgi:glucose-fructose oxidoreductase
MNTTASVTPGSQDRKVRYAVVGLGWIAQEAVLPGFSNAPNSELTALVTRDPKKAEEVASKYQIKTTISYDDYDDLLASGKIDAVYITLPNLQHREFSVRAAQAGIHVLCEKPMAVTEADCMSMIEAAEQARVKLMIAYRLHFEEANLFAIDTVKSGKIGEPRFFLSVFSQSVAPDNVRLKADLGGGPLMDMGVYCINAAGYLFQEEPNEVSGLKVQPDDPRFREVPEMVSATLRFPSGRLASFICSFGAAPTDSYRIVGTKGDLRLEPAYDYHEAPACYLTIGGKTEKKSFSQHDQFGAELLYFSRCVLENRDPQPSGWEGLADVRVIRAIIASIKLGQPVTLTSGAPPERPRRENEIDLPPVKPPRTFAVASPTGRT